jgi:hypothetical protein
MEELDLSKELQEFYENNKDNTLIRNYEETLKDSTGFFKTSKLGYDVIDNSLKEENQTFKKTLTKKDFVFSIQNQFYYFNSFFLFKSRISINNLSDNKRFLKVDYLNLNSIKKVTKYTTDFKSVPSLSSDTVFLKSRSVKFFSDDIFYIYRDTKNNTLDSKTEYDNLDSDENFQYKMKQVKEGLFDKGYIFNKVHTLIEEPFNELERLKDKKRKEQERLEEKQELIKEDKRQKELKVSQTNVLSELDKDGNGEVDVIEGNDFNLLLKKHQNSIVEVDRTYVQQFVKISSYLKTKEKNIQSIFNSIKDTPNQEVLNEYVEILKGEIHTYNLILFNSLNMIVSLVEDDMITFYEIHEMFDTLNMFDSKHEKDVSQRLTNIGDGLESLMYEIRDMGNQISNSIQELSYVTEESNQQLNEQLSEIDSTMKAGNLINAINAYQNYKINKNTKSLRG